MLAKTAAIVSATNEALICSALAPESPELESPESLEPDSLPEPAPAPWLGWLPLSLDLPPLLCLLYTSDAADE